MTTKKPISIALVVPHIFLHRDILPHVIFSPGKLAIELAEGLVTRGARVTLYSPGPVDTSVPTVQADLSYFEAELAGRGDTYIELLKKHPFTFVSLARQVQSEIIAKAYAAANSGEHDIVHIYTNEEDTALPFAELCNKPVVFTHHDPFNFMVKYKNVFPKYAHLDWISLSQQQRSAMPADTRWLANIPHGVDEAAYQPIRDPSADYVAYFGRIIEPKGVHLAIKAVRKYNETADRPLRLKIAGKHYSDGPKDSYWQHVIEPELDELITYEGFIKDTGEKNNFLGNARTLIIPSLFDEPFGMVMIEALASGTPLVGLDSGAIPEVITDSTGILVKKQINDDDTTALLATALGDVVRIQRSDCRADFEKRFTTARMCRDHLEAYEQLLTK